MKEYVVPENMRRTVLFVVYGLQVWWLIGTVLMGLSLGYRAAKPVPVGGVTVRHGLQLLGDDGLTSVWSQPVCMGHRISFYGLLLGVLMAMFAVGALALYMVLPPTRSIVNETRSSGPAPTEGCMWAGTGCSMMASSFVLSFLLSRLLR